MNGETVVRNEVTAFGQHWVEVMRMGAPVEAGRWMEAAPVEAMHLVRRWARHEAGVDIHRLYMWWPAREWMKLTAPVAKLAGTEAVVLWYIEDQTLREAAARAAWVWRRRRKCEPARVLVAKLPTGAPETFGLDDCPEVIVRLERAAWVPRGYLVISG